MKKKTINLKHLKNLTSWDWEVLVAAWRYYENRNSIAATMFPANLVTRFFKGKYKEDVCHKIAHQFVEIDHSSTGEDYWCNAPNDIKLQWCKLYAFLNAYLHGFTTKDGVECFYCKTANLYYIKDKYIENPHVEFYMVD